MHDEEYANVRFGKSSTMAPLVLPNVEGEHRRIIYTITEYEPLLDSSNMTFHDWVKIAQDIQVRSQDELEDFQDLTIFCSFSNLTNSSMALSSSTAPTLYLTPHRRFLLCSRTSERLSSSRAHKSQSSRLELMVKTIS